MECNKDDAIKAKEIAERKFTANDIAGAMKFALKAHNLYPGLEGIAQLLMILDVHASAENQVGGEADWYGVLGVSPEANEDAIRKQYRKLVLTLHPDKNKSFGAEGAFKLISQAWSLLSDKSRRAAYDAKRNPRGFHQKGKNPSEGSSMPPGTNGFYNFMKTTTSNAKSSKNTTQANGSSTSGSTNKSNPNTFWTICHRCRMQYEYLRSYLNQNLLCPTCRQPFFATEQPAPEPKSSRSSKQRNSGPPLQKSHQESRAKTNPKDDFQWVPFSGAPGVSSVAQAANVVQQTYEKVRRVREEAQAAKKREKTMKKKNHVSENVGGSSTLKKQRVREDIAFNNHQRGLATDGFGVTSSPLPGSGDIGSVHNSATNKFNKNRDLLQNELLDLLMHKAQKIISKSVNDFKSARYVEKPQIIEKNNRHDKSKDSLATNSGLHDAASTKAADGGNGAEVNAKPNATPSLLTKKKIIQPSIPVPASDFQDFDKNRTERAFDESDVWAVYDNDDGMPRYYVMIHRVISRDPFRLRIIWLTSRTNTEFGPLSWVNSGFTKTCGEFRLGRHETFEDLCCFSHKVRWIKGSFGAISIFPRKGDVWALYRNWSPDWDEQTGNNVIHTYDMVEVLEDYDEALGVLVIPLVKVAGFKALFHQHLDPMQVRRVPNEEVFRFSHQVPSHMISGREAPNAPKGCRELDPAALPVEFLQVIADVREDIGENKVTEPGQISIDDDAKPLDVDTNAEDTKEEVT